VGWAPPYGRWVLVESQWCWVPAAPAVRVRYAPALVAFVGGGPVVGASVTFGAGMVGWFPLAPRDPLVPWWGRRGPIAVTNVTNVTYVNRTQVTVVNQSTFVSGALVSTAVVRERSTIRQAAEAPVVAGPVPITPTVSSTRVSVRRDAPAARPPQAVAAGVTRAAPPPRASPVRAEGRGDPGEPRRAGGPGDGAKNRVGRERPGHVPVRPVASAAAT
jgi:hypothetical protein